MCNPTNYGSNPSVTLRQELQRELFHDAKRGDQDFTKGTITLEKCMNQSWKNQSPSWGKNSSQGNLGNTTEDG